VDDRKLDHTMQKFAEQAANAAAARERMAQVKGNARNADGSITVTVAPSGAVLGLQLAPEALKRTHTQLQQEILATIRQATLRAADAMEQTARPLLGERFDEFRDALNAHSVGGPAAYGPTTPPHPANLPGPDPAPAPQRRRPAPRDTTVEDEDFSHRGVLRRKP
jgi:DNA-binding protein YbaB